VNICHKQGCRRFGLEIKDSRRTKKDKKETKIAERDVSSHQSYFAVGYSGNRVLQQCFCLRDYLVHVAAALV